MPSNTNIVKEKMNTLAAYSLTGKSSGEIRHPAIKPVHLAQT